MKYCIDVFFNSRRLKSSLYVAIFDFAAIFSAALIIPFSRPYRAAAFVENLQPRFGDIRLDWFRLPDGGFDVVMLYTTEKQLSEGQRLLSGMGF